MASATYLMATTVAATTAAHRDRLIGDSVNQNSSETSPHRVRYTSISIKSVSDDCSSDANQDINSPHQLDTLAFALIDDDLPQFISKFPMLSTDSLRGFNKKYVTSCNVSRRILNTKTFRGIVIVAIAWASVSVGIQTYPTMGTNMIINILNYITLGVFILEAMIKIHSQGLEPWKYFTGKEWRWNNFDFAIIIMSLPIWGSVLGHNVMILRLFQLLRIMKIVKQIPELYMIVMGLISGLNSLGYMLLVLFMVYYLYAIAGTIAWKDTDPFHFRNVLISMLTLFRISTLENWMNVLTINYYGCDRFNGEYYSNNPEDAHKFQYCNTTAMFGADMNLLSPQDIAYQRDMRRVVAALYFISFVLICALVALSLVIGAVTKGMEYSMEEMREAKARKEENLKILRRQLRALEAKAEERASALRLSMNSSMSAEYRFGSECSSHPRLSKVNSSDMRKLRVVLRTAWNDGGLVENFIQEEEEEEEIGKVKRAYLKVADAAASFVANNYFQHFITIIILLASILVGVQTSNTHYSDGSVVHVLDILVLMVFTAEVVVKVVAEGLQPWVYFQSGWNVFDFVIVVGSFLPGSGDMLLMIRLLRLLRVLKLAHALPRLQVIVRTILMAVKSLGYICLTVFLCVYVFSIVGHILFADNDPFHFGKLHFAMMTLLRCASMDGWSDVMYINAYGCDAFPSIPYELPDNKCNPNPKGWIAVIYFCLFTLFGMVLISLFVGTVTANMDQATYEQVKEQELLQQVEFIRLRHGADRTDVKAYVQVFKLLDQDNNGVIEAPELRTGLAVVGKYPTQSELKDMMDVVDADGDGEISLVEFVEFMIIQRAKAIEDQAF